MAKPYIHAKSSARKYGGEPEDYLDIHQFMDSTKAAMADVRHRAILHNAFGCFVAERVFGTVRTNSDGREYSPRDIAEQHVIEDMGHIPSIQDWLEGIEVAEWMGAPKVTKQFIPFDKEQDDGDDKRTSEDARRLPEVHRGVWPGGST